MSTLKFQALTQPTTVATLHRDTGTSMHRRSALRSVRAAALTVPCWRHWRWADGNMLVAASSAADTAHAAEVARKGSKKSRKRSSKSPQFGLLSRLHVAGRPLVVTAIDDSIVVLDPHPGRMRVCAWVKDLGRVMDVSVRVRGCAAGTVIAAEVTWCVCTRPQFPHTPASEYSAAPVCREARDTRHRDVLVLHDRGSGTQLSCLTALSSQEFTGMLAAASLPLSARVKVCTSSLLH